jgi:hypothetical protein
VVATTLYVIVPDTVLPVPAPVPGPVKTPAQASLTVLFVTTVSTPVVVASGSLHWPSM